MATQQIVNVLILDNRNLVIEEFMKYDDCLSMDWGIQKIAEEMSVRCNYPDIEYYMARAEYFAVI